MCDLPLYLYSRELIESLFQRVEMAKIHLSNVVVLDNPSPFEHPFQFEVTFECNEELKEGTYQNDYAPSART